MSAAGWFFMIASLSLVWSVAIWSFTRLLKAPPPDKNGGGGPSPPPISP